MVIDTAERVAHTWTEKERAGEGSLERGVGGERYARRVPDGESETGVSQPQRQQGSLVFISDVMNRS